MNTTEAITFAIGDKVDWTDPPTDIPGSEDQYSAPHRTVKRFGRGPYKVTEVFDVPEFPCNCPGGIHQGHDELCSVWKGRMSAGHHQRLCLIDSRARPMGRFSGMWFKRVS